MECKRRAGGGLWGDQEGAGNGLGLQEPDHPPHWVGEGSRSVGGQGTPWGTRLLPPLSFTGAQLPAFGMGWDLHVQDQGQS